MNIDHVGSRIRIREAREGLNRSEEEVAQLVGITTPAYRDLENCDGDLSMTLSLESFRKLCSILQIDAGALFGQLRTPTATLSPAELALQIQAYLSANGMPVTEFEAQVGFEIQPALYDSSEVLKWNIDCLRFVCAEIGTDWVSVLR
jgi:transcriptional regulator with XRE-family HTH domain